jgi:hypothetical protein
VKQQHELPLLPLQQQRRVLLLAAVWVGLLLLLQL